MNMPVSHASVEDAGVLLLPARTISPPVMTNFGEVIVRDVVPVWVIPAVLLLIVNDPVIATFPLEAVTIKLFVVPSEVTLKS